MPNKCNGKHLKLRTPATYRIEVEGDLDESLSDRLGGMHIPRRRRDDQTTVMTVEGRVRDQAELIGVLNSLYALCLPILSVENLTEKNGEEGHDPDKSSPSEPEREIARKEAGEMKTSRFINPLNSPFKLRERYYARNAGNLSHPRPGLSG